MAQPKITPVGGNILVRPESGEKITASGIILPDSASKEKPQKGTIVALGTGRIDEKGNKVEFNVKVGQTVLFKKYSPDEIEIDGEDYLIMDEEAILAILG